MDKYTFFDSGAPCAPPLKASKKASKVPSVLSSLVYDSYWETPALGFSEPSRAFKTSNVPSMRRSTSFKNKENTPSLSFSSNFESGNLRQAHRLGTSNEYNLILESDDGVKVNTLWFYFAVSNQVPGIPYTFNIVNLVKSGSLFGQGLQPVMRPLNSDPSFPERDWRRVGYDVTYSRTSSAPIVAHLRGLYSGKKMRHAKKKAFCTASFKIVFDGAKPIVLAYCFPFSVSNQQQYLTELQAAHDPSAFVLNRSTLCRTVASHACEVITITSHSNQEHKKGIVLSARVHPGETSSSWVMKGVIDRLTSRTDPIAAWLREHSVARIVPMLNPDGVAKGVYRSSPTAFNPHEYYGKRTSEQGVDLNRKWHLAKASSHPTLHHTKAMISAFQQTHDVVLYCDFHGHSEAWDSFAFGFYDSVRNYSRPHKKVPHPCTSTDAATHFCRLYDLSCASHPNGKGVFSLSGSSLYIPAELSGCQGVGPISVFTELGVPHCYTIEHSMGCSTAAGGRQFDALDYLKLGHTFCEALFHWLGSSLPSPPTVDSPLSLALHPSATTAARVQTPRPTSARVASSCECRVCPRCVASSTTAAAAAATTTSSSSGGGRNRKPAARPTTTTNDEDDEDDDDDEEDDDDVVVVDGDDLDEDDDDNDDDNNDDARARAQRSSGSGGGGGGGCGGARTEARVSLLAAGGGGGGESASVGAVGGPDGGAKGQAEDELFSVGMSISMLHI